MGHDLDFVVHHACSGELTFVDLSWGGVLVCRNQYCELLSDFFGQLGLLLR